MADVELMVSEGKKLAEVIKTKWGGKGKELNEIVKSVERALPVGTVQELYNVAELTNKAVYGNDEKDEYLDDRKKFVATCADLHKKLKDGKPDKAEVPAPFVIFLIFLVLLFLLRNF